jgi:hypothetical protein
MSMALACFAVWYFCYPKMLHLPLSISFLVFLFGTKKRPFSSRKMQLATGFETVFFHELKGCFYGKAYIDFYSSFYGGECFGSDS